MRRAEKDGWQRQMQDAETTRRVAGREEERRKSENYFIYLFLEIFNLKIYYL